MSEGHWAFETPKFDIKWKRSFFEIRNTVDDCAHMCLLMAARALGGNPSYLLLRREFLPGNGGLTALELKKAAHSIGIDVDAFTCDAEDLSELTCPAILLLEQHYVFLLNDRGQTIVGDPAVGVSRGLSKDVLADWSGVVLAMKPAHEGVVRHQGEKFLKNAFYFLRFVRSPFWLLFGGLIIPLAVAGEGFLLKRAGNLINGNASSPSLYFTVLLVFAVLVVKEAGDLWRSWVLLKSTQFFDMEVSRRLVGAFLRLPYSRLIAGRFGDLSILLEEVGILRRFLIGSAIQTFILLISVLIFSFLTIHFSPSLFLLVVILGMITFLFMLGSREKQMEQTKMELLSRERLLSSIREMFLSVGSLMRRRLQHYSLARLEQQLQKNFIRSANAARYSSKVRMVLDTMNLGSEILILVLLLAFSRSGQLALGSILFGYWISTALLENVSGLMASIVSFKRVSLSMRRLDPVMGLKDLDLRLQPLPFGKTDEFQVDSLEAKSLSFQYSSSVRETISDVSFTFKPPGVFALMGESGSGKSTLGLILGGLLTERSGGILINGKMMDSAQRSGLIRVILQREGLFGTTLLKNITLSDSKPDQLRLERALRVAQVNSILSDLPEGLGASMDLHSGKFSEGQRQRIILARALYHDPKFLIMDESTSSLDLKSEEQFLSAVKMEYPNLCLVLISHRSYSSGVFKDILRLKHGQLVSQPG